MSTPYWGPDFDALAAFDPDIAGVVTDELDRLRGGLQLIASENFTSPAVLAALGSTLSNKYAEGGQHGRGGEVLARDQLQAAAQPVELAEHHGGDLRVLGLQGVEVGPPERGAAGCGGRGRGRGRVGGGL